MRELIDKVIKLIEYWLKKTKKGVFVLSLHVYALVINGTQLYI